MLRKKEKEKREKAYMEESRETCVVRVAAGTSTRLDVGQREVVEHGELHLVRQQGPFEGVDDGGHCSFAGC